MALPEENPIYGPFFGVMGAAAAIIFSGKLIFPKKKDDDLANFWCKFWSFLMIFKLHKSFTTRMQYLMNIFSSI